METLKFLLPLLSLLVIKANSSKILMLYPLAAGSESNMARPLALELTKNGHRVTFVTPKGAKVHEEVENMTEISPLKPPTTLDWFPIQSESEENILVHRRLYKNPLLWLWTFSMKSVRERCHAVYGNREFQKSVLEKEFDLLIINGNLHECFLGLVDKFKAPWILVDTMPFAGDIFQGLGNPMPSAIIPMSVMPLTDEMDFSQRVLNFFLRWMSFLWGYSFRVGHPAENLYRRYLGQNIPSVFEIQKSVSLIFSNSHFALTFPRSFTPDIVEIGGIHCKPVKGKLEDKILESFVSESAGGFVYFSMGSMFKESSFPHNIRHAFESLFRKFELMEIRVLYKAEYDGEFDEINRNGNWSRNVLIRRWFPQQNILGHNKIRLFITHGGIQSYLEAAYHGVPQLLFPIWGEQALVGAQVDRAGNGKQLEILDVNEKYLENGAMEILTDPKYTAKAKRLSSMFKNQPQTPLERSVFWTEFVLKYGGAKELRSPAREMSLLTAFGFDILLAFILSIVMAVISIRITSNILKRGEMRIENPIQIKFIRSIPNMIIGPLICICLYSMLIV